MSYLIPGLLVAAGAAIVVQNLLMAHITGNVSTVLVTLVINSAVGFMTLLVLLIAKTGLSGIYETLGSFRSWSVLPGLLGSFFVFASILGYQRLGAAATISILVASQLIFGLAVDILRSYEVASQNYLSAIAGAGLLVAGAFLVASRNL